MSSAFTARVIAEARSWCGTPYAHQAAVKHIGTDCLGLLRGVHAALYPQAENAPPYIPPYVPPYAPHAEADEDEPLLKAAQTYLHQTKSPLAGGQVLLFRMRRNLPIRHVGIATSPDAMVHAMSGGPVCEIALSLWWHRHCAARFTFPQYGEQI